MQAFPTHHRLGSHELMRLAQPARLQVTEGSLWITLDLEPEDLLIDAGSSYEYDGHSPLIASALGGPAAFTSLAPAAAAAIGWRSWLQSRQRLRQLLAAWA